MEGEEIGLVLARATELRAKISNCIDRSGGIRGREADPGDGGTALTAAAVAAAAAEEEEESLLSIRHALESLERQLAALQALQQQQRYEREEILAQIDCSRMVLLSKLKEYKGEDLEVIHEATAFAGETVDRDDGLVLPPYPSHLPDLFVLDDLYPSSHFTSKYKLSQNGLTADRIHDTKESMVESEKNQRSHQGNRNPPRGIRFVFGLVAKSVMTFVSVMSILSLAGYKPMHIKEAIQFKALELFGKPAGEERLGSIQCPPGKILVIEDGKPRCLVKERVEIPFESVVSAPKISYGFG
ncbi:plastid division protein PDV2-like [Phoenix dactylifera]|uniref:Plastid division protein PDV2-like n=1 Tax=Phoenix dactylifera TaxID=42345 RepID=A0A8B7CDR9_PHODC|nr:plastid division protein PDV2-like [Phoenix dactylifera]